MTGRRRAARDGYRTAPLFGGPVDAMVGRDHVPSAALQPIVIAFATSREDQTTDATCSHRERTKDRTGVGKQPVQTQSDQGADSSANNPTRTQEELKK